ncbi:MAG: hypothetical protein ACOC2J_02770 [bacterium]
MSTAMPKDLEKTRESQEYNGNCNNSDLFILALSKNLSYDELVEYKNNQYNN